MVATHDRLTVKEVRVPDELQGLNAEARELEEKIGENVSGLLGS
tara:strand:- start:650 stop:781 length:132 start_codon:yes stop_codon:yes gene_type:complete